MRSFTATTLSTLALALCASAFQVTQPSQNSGWTSTGTNTLAWSRVSTDSTNFTVVLTNLDRTVLPQNNQVLVNFVDATTQSSLAVAAPSGGFPTGSGFRINLVKSANEVDTILAQSDNFVIAAGSGTGSSASGSTVTAGASSSTTSAAATGTVSTVSVTQGTTAVLTSGTVSVPADGSSTDTSLNPSATTNANAAASRHVEFGLLGAMLLLGAVLA